MLDTYYQPPVTEGFKKVATICILRSGDYFLLIKRIKEPNKNFYTPLGGKLDPFETPLNAAIRETWEESGIKVQHMEFKGILTETSPKKYNWISYVYLADIDRHITKKSEEGLLEWIHVDSLLEIPTSQTDWFIYKYIKENKKFILNAEYNNNMEIQWLINELTEEKLIG
ncbi:8-oxo-dGTP diphosphatase [Belliella buryatensis]|uniref:8-oxo-dGTP diphosphatase n=1 Tax=Belliella buryatensis TaxID=1500549 RepID=A0A239C2M9_9BACT|nr:NUDIX domain-containing protein [Belliella buryatensis]SNS14426.1 8-oxo-dGTP diphosphatase [Belliella buryatensis]